jgi:hypothetical protein
VQVGLNGIIERNCVVLLHRQAFNPIGDLHEVYEGFSLLRFKGFPAIEEKGKEESQLERSSKANLFSAIFLQKDLHSPIGFSDHTRHQNVILSPITKYFDHYIEVGI